MSTETILAGLILAVSAFIAIRERVKVQPWRVSEQSPPANIAGVLAGRQDYEYCHREELAVIEAADLAGMRQSGRHLGEPVTVYWDPRKCSIHTNESVIPWLMRHGPPNGVNIQEVQR